MDRMIAAPGFSQTQYYEYDATNRLKIAVEGAPVPGSLTCPATSSWCREYSYDHFGRRGQSPERGALWRTARCWISYEGGRKEVPCG